MDLRDLAASTQGVAARMKIGFFGNTNNFPLTLARALRRLGHDVLFFVDSEYILHRPEHRYEDIPYPYDDWIIDVSPMRLPHYAFPNRKRARVISMLRECDAVVLNGLGTTMLEAIGRPAFLLLTGSDLEYFANLESIRHLMWSRSRRPQFVWRAIAPPLVRLLNARVVPAQRRGIQLATAYTYFPRGLMPHGDTLLAELGVDDERRSFFMMADLDGVDAPPLPNNDPLRVYSATRFNWKAPIPPGMTALDYKGSDVMIRGLGLFYRRSGVRLNIRLVKKGLHVTEAMDLVREEGIEDQVTWLEEMTQRQVHEEFVRADITLEQFGASIPGMAALDAMALGRPVIADARPEVMERVIGARSAICQARTAEEVCQQMLRLLDPIERERVGRESRSYVEKYFSPESAVRLILSKLEPAIARRAAKL